MGIGEKLTGGIAKHTAFEILGIASAGVVISAIGLFLMVQYFAIDISFSLGNILLVFIPCILILALGGAIMSYSPKLRYVGLGMAVVALAVIILQILELVYYGIS